MSEIYDGFVNLTAFDSRTLYLCLISSLRILFALTRQGKSLIVPRNLEKQEGDNIRVTF